MSRDINSIRDDLERAIMMCHKHTGRGEIYERWTRLRERYHTEFVNRVKEIRREAGDSIALGPVKVDEHGNVILDSRQESLIGGRMIAGERKIRPRPRRR